MPKLSRTHLAIGSSLLCLSILMLSYQNCSVRRMDLADDPSSSEMMDPEILGGGDGQVGLSCVGGSPEQFSLSGFADLPAMKSQYSTRMSASGTSVTLVASSECFKENMFGGTVKCVDETEEPVCQSRPVVMLTLLLNCSSQDGAMNCEYQAGDEIDLATAPPGKVTLSLSYHPDICDGSNASVYFHAPVGKLKILDVSSLSDGSQVKVAVENVSLDKYNNATGAASPNSTLLNGVLTTKIATPSVCE
jgi:hypothetical protein